MSVLHLAERVHGTGIVLVITTPEGMAHETDTRIATVDEGSIHWGYLLYMSASRFLPVYIKFHLLQYNLNTVT